MGISSCKIKHDVMVNNTAYRLALPPNMSRIGENLFMDVTEMQNDDYLFYVFWDYGREHQLPEQEHWPYYQDLHYYNIGTRSTMGQSQSWQTCLQRYWSDPSYMSYPIVGISYKNALKYTHWRESRILEVILIENDLIDADSVNKYPITLREFIDGKVTLKPSLLKWIAVPRLYLPSERDFERALLADDEAYFASRREKRRTRKQVPYVKLYPDDSCYGLMDLRCSSAEQNNNYAVYNLDDCVDEYVRQKSDVRGKESLLRFNGLDFVPTDEEGQIDTGFRNVAEYIIVELPVKN